MAVRERGGGGEGSGGGRGRLPLVCLWDQSRHAAMGSHLIHRTDIQCSCFTQFEYL